MFRDPVTIYRIWQASVCSEYIKFINKILLSFPKIVLCLTSYECDSLFLILVLFSFVHWPPTSTLARVIYLYPHFESRDSRENWINTPGDWQGCDTSLSSCTLSSITELEPVLGKVFCLFLTSEDLSVLMILYYLSSIRKKKSYEAGKNKPPWCLRKPASCQLMRKIIIL